MIGLIISGAILLIGLIAISLLKASKLPVKINAQKPYCNGDCENCIEKYGCDYLYL